MYQCFKRQADFRRRLDDTNLKGRDRQGLIVLVQGDEGEES